MTGKEQKVVRVYMGEDRRSHFEDVQVPMGEFRLGTLFSYKTAMAGVSGVVEGVGAGDVVAVALALARAASAGVGEGVALALWLPAPPPPH